MFSWLGGGEYSTNPTASKMLQEKGYKYIIGYELENICPVGKDTLSWPEIGSDVVGNHIMADEKIEEEIRYHQSIMETIGIFSAVPAILPLYRAEKPYIGQGQEEDILLADHFYNVACYLRKNLKLSEWEAVHRALDILAVNMIGEDFSYHL